MKALAIGLIIFASVLAQAEDKADANKGFSERKAKALEMIDKRVSGMQEMKTCVSSAADHNAMKACHEKHHEAMMGMRMEMEEMRHKHKMEKMKNHGGNNEGEKHEDHH